MLLPREIVMFSQACGFDPFAPAALKLLEQDPAAASLRSRAEDSRQPLSAVLLGLQVARILAASTSPSPEAEFVATVPPGMPCPARPTPVVLREMLDGPHQEVIALGYEISDDGFVKLLLEAALQCPSILLLCDRGKGSAPKLRKRWPQDRNLPNFHENVEVASPPLSSMHCKALLVDGRDLFVTSANFTFHGLSGNIEFGVRLRGERVRGAREIFFELLRSGLFRPLEGSR